MIITDIQKQKHNEKRYSIFVDGEYSFSVSDVDLLYYKLNIGDTLSAEKANIIANNNLLAKAKTIAANFIGYRMRSRKEVILRLKREELPKDIIAKTIHFLEKYNYINDEEFAKAFISEKKKLNGYGGIRLKNELYQKGVSSEIIEKLEYLLEDNNDQILQKLINKKLKGMPPENKKEYNRVLAFLCRRGYSCNKAKTAIEEYIYQIKENPQ